MWRQNMVKYKWIRAAAVICLALMLTCCGKGNKGNDAGSGATSGGSSAGSADTDLDTDSEREEAQQDEIYASTDLFFEDGDVCTQFLRLIVPDQFGEDPSFHYFQDPEADRYALDIMEGSSVNATDGVGGLVYSIVLYETYPEERGMENSAYLGMLKDEQGGYYYVFLEFPSGKQYAPSSEEAYSAAADTSSWIAENIEGRNGYTFEAGKESESAKE